MFLQAMKSWMRPDKVALTHNCVCTCVCIQWVVQLLLSCCHYTLVCNCVYMWLSCLQHPVSTLHTTTAYDHLLKILVVGDRGSNKRTLLRKYIGDTEMSDTTTLGKYSVSFPCHHIPISMSQLHSHVTVTSSLCHCSMPPYPNSRVTVTSFPCHYIPIPCHIASFPCHCIHIPMPLYPHSMS